METSEHDSYYYGVNDSKRREIREGTIHVPNYCNVNRENKNGDLLKEWYFTAYSERSTTASNVLKFLEEISETASEYDRLKERTFSSLLSSFDDTAKKRKWTICKRELVTRLLINTLIIIDHSSNNIRTIEQNLKKD